MFDCLVSGRLMLLFLVVGERVFTTGIGEPAQLSHIALLHIEILFLFYNIFI